MQKLKKIITNSYRYVGPLAMALAVLTANSTCFFYSHQPDVPSKLLNKSVDND